MTSRRCWDDSRLVISSHVPFLGGQAAIFLGFFSLWDVENQNFFHLKVEVILFLVYILGSIKLWLHCSHLPVQSPAIASFFHMLPYSFHTVCVSESDIQGSSTEILIHCWHFHSSEHCGSCEELGCDVLCCVTLGKGTDDNSSVTREYRSKEYIEGQTLSERACSRLPSLPATPRSSPFFQSIEEIH